MPMATNQFAYNLFPLPLQICKGVLHFNDSSITSAFLYPTSKSKAVIKNGFSNAPHLKDLIKFFDDNFHDKIILECDDLNFGTSTAGQIACCMKTFLFNKESKSQKSYFDDDFYANHEDDDDYYDENDEDINNIDNTFFLVVYESEFDPNCNNIGETTMLKELALNTPKIDYSQYNNIIFVADGIFSLTKKSVDFLQLFSGNVVVVIPSKSKNSNAVNILTFESDFEEAYIKQPDTIFFVRQLKFLALKKGYKFDTNLNLHSAIDKLISFRGVNFQEYDLSFYLDKCIRENQNDYKIIYALHKLKDAENQQSSNEMLNSIIGLKKIKENINETFCKELHYKKMAELGHSSTKNYKHLAFTGNPGTCKTTIARIMAKLYKENNIISNSFFECSREDLVGRFVGETGQKVRTIFENARGGVLFIDEIGSLVSAANDDKFATEALDMIVRHMENHPETMVIMATYPDEFEKILSINPGLKSRISNIINFPDYDNDELLEIFKTMVKEKGYTLEKGYGNLVKDYFSSIRNQKNFGNGREARKLLEKAIGKLAVEQKNKKPRLINKITLSSLRKAIDELSKETQNPNKRSIGFSMGEIINS